MVDTETQAQYRRDASVLAALGSQFLRMTLPNVEVRVPRALTDKVVAAWERDEEGSLDPKDSEQRIQCHQAASLALIGLSTVNGGLLDGDEIVVGLQPGLIGDPLNGADDLP